MSSVSQIAKIEIEDQLVKIPAGNIVMRDDRNKTEWIAEVNEFYLAKYPVSQAFYHLITQKSPSAHTGDQLPVENVSWLDAVEFCNQLSEALNLEVAYEIEKGESLSVDFRSNANGFRLPNEAEWQFASQGGSNRTSTKSLAHVAWYKNNSGGKTHDIGLLEPNNFGLYDMLGNVWEWCSDIYDESVYGSYRTFKGGGWNDEERSVMPTTRRRSHPVHFKIDDLGFRIALSSNKNSNFFKLK